MKQETISIVTGNLEKPHEIKTPEGQTVKIDQWTGRAIYGFLRLAYGRKIDDIIKTISRDDREEFYYYKLQHAPKTEPLQFIMASGDVAAVATTKHIIIPPTAVYDTATQILGPPTPDLTRHVWGQAWQVKQVAGIKIGVQIDGGDLITRNAVRVSAFARVAMCFNPLSWLGVSSLSRFADPGNFERLLRIQKLNELFPRLQAAINNTKATLPDLETKIENSKLQQITVDQARVINGSMGLSYGLGEKSLDRIMEQFKKEDQTQYGLAMAQSWEAEHGIHRQTSKGLTDQVPQKLSTISGATLLIEDIKTAAAKAQKWLGNQKSELAKEILEGKQP